MKKILIGLILSLSSLAQAEQYMYCNADGQSKNGDFKLKQVVFAVTEVEPGSTDAYLSVLPMYNIKVTEVIDGKKVTRRIDTSDRFSTYYENINDANNILNGKKPLNIDVQGMDLHTNGYVVKTQLDKRTPIFKIYKNSTSKKGQKDLIVTGRLSCKKENMLGTAKCLLAQPTFAYDKFFLVAYKKQVRNPFPPDKRIKFKDVVEVKAFVLSKANQIVSSFKGQTSIKDIEAFAAGSSREIDGKREFALDDMTSDKDSAFFIPRGVNLNFGSQIKGLKSTESDVRSVKISWDGSEGVSASCVINNLTQQGAQ